MDISLELDEASSHALAQIRAATGLNFSEIFSYALSVMLWMVKQRKSGRIIASMNEGQRTYRELELAALKKQTKAA